MLTTIAAIINALLPFLSRIIPDPDKRLEAQTEIQKALIENQDKIYESMKEVMVADVQSDTKYTKYARPTIVYWSLGIITGIVFLAPFGYDDSILSALTEVPDMLWTLMTVGIGAFSLGRSGEKIVRNLKQ